MTKDARRTSAGEVWVFAEVAHGRLAPVARELLGKGAELAAGLGGTVAAVLIGDQLEAAAGDAAVCGAERIYLAESPLLADYATLPYARLLGDLAERLRPDIILYGATPLGRDLAPRLSARLGTGLTADCTGLAVGPHRTKDRAYERLLLQVRPAFGGNVIATIVTPDHRPQMATVRPGVFPASRAGSEDQDVGRQAEIVRVDVALQDQDLVVRILDRREREAPVDLAGAQVVVAGGAGLGSAEDFRLVEELAETLGGVVGATRAAVDAGWVGRDHQIGQTGAVVRPKLYVAAGISGSVQHTAGMDGSARILAINTDPAAPVFSLAHYGIVGDVREVIPKLIRAYRSSRRRQSGGRSGLPSIANENDEA